MHSHPRFHKSHFGLSCDLGNVAVTVLFVLLFLIFLFLFLTITAPSAQGQSLFPCTPAHAATRPQLASLS